MALKPPRYPSADRRGPGAGDLALQNAAAAIQSGRVAEAEKLAADVLKANAGSLPALQMLGTALLMQGRGEEAIAPLERATRQARDAPTEMHLAMALRQAGREQEACERFERVIKRKPPFPPAFLEFASLLSALSRYDEAVEILQQGLVIAPNFAELSLRLGRLHAAQGRNAEARDVLARAVALAPGDPNALFALARTHQALHEFADAAEAYRRILAATPKHAPALIGLGICQIEHGRTEEGLEHLRMASRASARMYGEVVTALVDAGRGRFWLRPSDAARALRGDRT